MSEAAPRQARLQGWALALSSEWLSLGLALGLAAALACGALDSSALGGGGRGPLEGLLARLAPLAGLASPELLGILALLLGFQLAARLILLPRPAGGQGARAGLPWLALTGFACVAFGGLRGAALAPGGSLELPVGEEAETVPVLLAGQPIEQFLGWRLGLGRWDPVARRGELSVREPGGEAHTLPLQVGTALRWRGWQILAEGQRLAQEPAALHLHWAARAEAARQGDLRLLAGGHAHLDSAHEVEWVSFDRDLAGLGPAVLLRLEGPAGQDLRWLHLQAPPGSDERLRTGPIALAVRGSEPGWRLRLALRPASPSWPGLLGFALLVCAALGAAVLPGARRAPAATRPGGTAP